MEGPTSGHGQQPYDCQLYVQEALKPVRETYPNLLLIHYMDDILMCHKDLELLKQPIPY